MFAWTSFSHLGHILDKGMLGSETHSCEHFFVHISACLELYGLLGSDSCSYEHSSFVTSQPVLQCCLLYSETHSLEYYTCSHLAYCELRFVGLQNMNIFCLHLSIILLSWVMVCWAPKDVHVNIFLFTSQPVLSYGLLSYEICSREHYIIIYLHL